MASATFVWNSGGVPITPFTVTQESGESFEDFLARCRRIVDDKAREFPPDE